ncbi:MAG: hypothetical protein GYB53_18100, partial [Rhodobacteraceae bacterium]|nr:hypothetical protein [Paracoccaceae bacterium]
MVTVPSTPRVNTITLASASAGPFEVGFRLFEAAAVEVYVNGDIVSSGYTVTANFSDGYDDNATVLFDEALEAADVIVIFGKMVPQRGNDYGAVEPKLTAKLNLELGRIWTVLSEHRNGLDRALRGFNEAPIGDLEVEKAIYWSGTEFVAGPSLADIAAAQANAEAALAYAEAAEASAEDAATFDPSLFLTKAGNLAGVADTDAALATLGGGASGIAVLKLSTKGLIRSYLDLGSAAQQPFTDDDNLANNPSHVGTRGNAQAAINTAISALTIPTAISDMLFAPSITVGSMAYNGSIVANIPEATGGLLIELDLGLMWAGPNYSVPRMNMAFSNDGVTYVSLGEIFPQESAFSALVGLEELPVKLSSKISINISDGVYTGYASMNDFGSPGEYRPR